MLSVLSSSLWIELEIANFSTHGEFLTPSNSLGSLLTEPVHQDNEEGSLARAASLIGHLGDPHYLRKANALFYEFEEIGVNKQLGYASPADLQDLYPKFYFNSISPHLQTAIRYLNVTSSGRQWIADLYSNVFRAERDHRLSGPERRTQVL